MSTDMQPTVKSAMPAIPMGNRGMEIHSFTDAWEFANAVAKSRLSPKGLETPHAILIAVQMGAELGLPPMASLQNIAVINGRPSVWGDAMLAVCRGSGLFDEELFEETIAGDGEKLTATCTVRRMPNGKPVSRTFSIPDAKTAGLWGKAGPWSQYPKRMLQMRARSWALRDAFADVLRGFHSAEEMADVIDTESKPAKPATSLDDLADQLAPPEADPPELVTREAIEEAVARIQEATLKREIDAVVAEYEARDDLPEVTKAKIRSIGAERWAEIKAARGQRSNGDQTETPPEPAESEASPEVAASYERCEHLLARVAKTNDPDALGIIGEEADIWGRQGDLFPADLQSVQEAIASRV